MSQVNEKEQNPFAWYEEKDMNAPLSQGDLILDFPVPIIEEGETFPFLKAVAGEFPVIIMTQSCDLEQKKVTKLTVCPIQPVQDLAKSILIDEAKKQLIKEGAREEDIQEDKLVDFSKKDKKVKSILKSLKQGNLLDFYLLNKNEEGTNDTTIDMDYHVVLLRQMYQLPITSAQQISNHLIENQPKKLRLLPPYREHLAQAFANTFSRIGLPIDVNKEEMDDTVLKQIKE